MKNLFKDWKVHAFCLGILLVSELIGQRAITIRLANTTEGGLTFSLFPMLYCIVIGIILCSNKVISKEMMDTASPYIGISCMMLIVKMSSSIGPAWREIVKAGPALILQEFGNLGTILLSLPVAVLVFGMGRAAVGATFSISREPSLAIIADRYGLDSPEGTGIMGAYIAGTVLGTVFNGIMASVIVGMGIFHPIALAMASGTGSTSMMAAALAPVTAAYPEMAETLSAYAATSQTLSTADGLYMSLLIGIPLTNWLYKKLKPLRPDKVTQKQAAE